MRHKVIVLFLLLLIFIGCGKEYGQMSDAISSAHQGIQNIQAAYEAALLIKENIIESKEIMEPEEIEKLLENYRQSLELSQSNFNEALEIYRNIIKKEPEDAFLLNSLGHTYMWLNQKDVADKYFEQALQFCKSNSLQKSIEYNKTYSPEVEKHYKLFQEIDKYFQEI